MVPGGGSPVPGGFRLWARLTVGVVMALAVWLSSGPARAEVALTVNHPPARALTYTLAQLRAYPGVVIETSTPWTDGPQRFVGVSLRALLGDVPPSAMLVMRAVNDYAVTIPVVDIDNRFPIIAYERNGSPMSVRDKGPLWLVYPFDADIGYQTETAFARSIWQLVEITIDD